MTFNPGIHILVQPYAHTGPVLKVSKDNIMELLKKNYPLNRSLTDFVNKQSVIFMNFHQLLEKKTRPDTSRVKMGRGNTDTGYLSI